jgi:hypothetical protein
VEKAVDAVLASGLRTADLASGAEGEGVAGTGEVTGALLTALNA